MLIGGGKVVQLKGGERGNRKGTLTLTVANRTTSRLPSGKGEQNQILKPYPNTQDGHVNKTGFSVQHQPNVAIPFTRTGEGQNSTRHVQGLLIHDPPPLQTTTHSKNGKIFHINTVTIPCGGTPKLFCRTLWNHKRNTEK